MKDHQQIPQPAFVDTEGAARFLNLSRSYLEKRRFFRMEGPPFTMFGRAIRYRISDLEEWAAARPKGGES
jgi:hypothetical protein